VLVFFFKFFGNDTISISAGMFVNPTKLKNKNEYFYKRKARLLQT